MKHARKGYPKNMTLLIDANIILDVLQGRLPHLKDSSLVWKMCETKIHNGVISALTIPNIVYVMRKELTPEQTESILNKLLLIFDVADLTSEDLGKAASLRWNDYEDAIQSVIAERISADYIITRNTADYSDSIVPVLTPEEFITKHS